MSSADAPPEPGPDADPDHRSVEDKVTARVPRSRAAKVDATRRAGKAKGKGGRKSAPAQRASKVVLKRLDPFSVLKVSLLFYLSMFLIVLIAAVLLWAAATSIGVVGNIESFMVSIGFEGFTFEAPLLLRGVALGGAVLVLAGTFGNVVMALLYNLISEVVGGIKITLGEDAGRRRSV